ncbi:MAG TPA: Asp-tRNA(Asn)/Glu-tRNA(Gln) amidotransferase subunit GatB [Bacillota bacterium]|nr:Asp-tRNA(Asn)/Glu-tRNA(Gln) amidotransferase subunit GatB [Bacillota bacterium]
MKYETVIGLEVHVELLTDTKMFCGCKNEFGGDANTRCCPVCLGFPGALPTLNENAVEFAVKAGLATNCRIAEYSEMARKNYFYPDLPKAFQISQHNLPLCSNGYVDIEVGGITNRIGISRIHIEEDAGKLIHADEADDYSLVDYNRAGVPLIEIVSEPDIHTPEEGRQYLEKLRKILEYLEVSDCRMQEGSLRCDANISLRSPGESKLGAKVEIKNMNSMKALEKALAYEEARQAEVLDKDGKLIQETRRWDEMSGTTISMRGKEHAQDYRYFPEPDLVPIAIDAKRIRNIKSGIPELPYEREKRFIREFGLPAYDSIVLTSSKAIADFYEKCLIEYDNPKAVSNWVMGDFLRIMNDRGLSIKDIIFPPSYLIELLRLIDSSAISGTAAKQIFEAMFESGEKPEVLVKELGLEQISDEADILELVRKVIKDNPKSVKDYKEGNNKAMDFIIGQAMKASKGRGNPKVISETIKSILDNM